MKYKWDKKIILKINKMEVSFNGRTPFSCSPEIEPKLMKLGSFKKLESGMLQYIGDVFYLDSNNRKVFVSLDGTIDIEDIAAFQEKTRAHLSKICKPIQ